MTSKESKNWLKDWKSDIISHDKQKDDCSCGIHVIEVHFIYSKLIVI